MNVAGKVLLLSLVIVAAATPAVGQEPRPRPRIGVLMNGSETSSRIQLDGLRKGLAAAGMREGNEMVLDIRYADGNNDRLEPLAVDLIQSRPDILFTGGDQATLALKRAAAGGLPIIAVTCDALAAGLVGNLAHPGENLTGVTCINADLAAKRVEIMKELTTSLSRIGVALNSGDPRMLAELRECERAGSAQSIAITPLEIAKPDDIETALTVAAEKNLGGVVFAFDAMTFFYRARVAKVAILRRLPTGFNFRQFADAGGLFSYGPNLADMYRQSARHIMKVLKGEAPGDIPMEQPTSFELVINLKTAKAIGMSVPPSLLARADDVIE